MSFYFFIFYCAGAFYPGVPVQPVCLRYHNKLVRETHCPFPLCFLFLISWTFWRIYHVFTQILCLVLQAVSLIWSDGFDDACGVVGRLFIIPATCQYISGADLCRQLYKLPHWDKVADKTFSLIHNILTRAEPVPALTLWWQAPSKVAIWVTSFKSLVLLNMEKDSC